VKQTSRTHNAPDDECRLDNVLEAEYSHSKVRKHTRFCTQHAIQSLMNTQFSIHTEM